MSQTFLINLLPFIPPALLGLLLVGYDRIILDIRTPAGPKPFSDYTASEIFYSVFAAVTVIAGLIAGLWLLDTYEPVSRIVCCAFLLSISMPFNGLILAAWLDRRYDKGALFSTLIFVMAIAPTLLAFSALYYNGAADDAAPRKITVKVVNKRIRATKGGGVPVVRFEAAGFAPEILGRSWEKKISRDLYERIRISDRMELYIRPGTLGIAWMGELSFPSR